MRVRDLAAPIARALPVASPSKRRGRREGRVSTDTHGPRAAKSTRQNHRFSQIPAFPAQWCYGLYALSSVRRACWPPSPARCASIVANLASASGCQDHTTSPSARTRSSARSSHAASLSRPSHPSPRVVTIAIRPSCRGGTGRNVLVICPTMQVDARATDWHDGQSHRDHTAAAPERGRIRRCGVGRARRPRARRRSGRRAQPWRRARHRRAAARPAARTRR
jgi:hypothetical protein